MTKTVPHAFGGYAIRCLLQWPIIAPIAARRRIRLFSPHHPRRMQYPKYLRSPSAWMAEDRTVIFNKINQKNCIVAQLLHKYYNSLIIKYQLFVTYPLKPVSKSSPLFIISACINKFPPPSDKRILLVCILFLAAISLYRSNCLNS